MQQINDAQANDVIKLPNELIIIKDLLIKRPIKIIGGPDTILWIKNGSIRVLFEPRYVESKHKFIICECKIIYTNDINIQAMLGEEQMTNPEAERNIGSDEEDISINKVPTSKTFNKLNSNTASTQEQTNTQFNNSIALFTLESHSKIEMWDCFILSENDCGKT